MNIILAVSDIVWQAIIAGSVTVVLALIGKFYSNKANSKLNAIAEVGDQTHILVNSSMGTQLKLGADLSRWKANQTNLPMDIEAAELAEKRLLDHDNKQKEVDSK